MTRPFTVLLLLAPLALAQAGSQPGDVKVRVNYINVCTPGDAEQKEIAAALAAIPGSPRFATDFEVSRGRTTEGDVPSDWVRVRREFGAGSALSNAQYSISMDRKGIIETSVFRWRDPKDVLQISIEDSVTAGTPTAVVAADTPANRIRVERFGKSSLVVARCPQTNQQALEPLFTTASMVMQRYRVALGVRQLVPAELANLGASASPGSKGPSSPPAETRWR